MFRSFSVYKVFENVAQKYDVMNDAMSLGIHRLWKDTLLRVMNPQPGAQLLDMAGGTGKTLFSESWFKTLYWSDGGHPPPQVTSPSVSWSTFVPNRRSRGGGRLAPPRRRPGRTLLPRRWTGQRNPGLWSVTSTRRCWMLASRKQTAWESTQVLFPQPFSADLSWWDQLSSILVTPWPGLEWMTSKQNKAVLNSRRFSGLLLMVWASKCLCLVGQVCRGWWEMQRSSPSMMTTLTFIPSPLEFETSPTSNRYRWQSFLTLVGKQMSPSQLSLLRLSLCNHVDFSSSLNFNQC